MSDKKHDAEVAEAEAALRPHLNRLWAEYAAAWREKLRPVAVEVPQTFPRVCESGLLFKLPVRKTDVLEPKVVTLR